MNEGIKFGQDNFDFSTLKRLESISFSAENGENLNIRSNTLQDAWREWGASINMEFSLDNLVLSQQNIKDLNRERQIPVALPQEIEKMDIPQAMGILYRIFPDMTKHTKWKEESDDTLTPTPDKFTEFSKTSAEVSETSVTEEEVNEIQTHFSAWQYNGIVDKVKSRHKEVGVIGVSASAQSPFLLSAESLANDLVGQGKGEHLGILHYIVASQMSKRINGFYLDTGTWSRLTGSEVDGKALITGFDREGHIYYMLGVDGQTGKDEVGLRLARKISDSKRQVRQTRPRTVIEGSLVLGSNGNNAQ